MLATTRAPALKVSIEWQESMVGANRIFLSVETINEIERVTALPENSGAVVRAFRLKEWLRALISTYRDRIVSSVIINTPIAGSLEVNAAASANSSGTADTIVAAVTDAHDLHSLTGNTKAFLQFSLAVS
jgi:predicted nucleic acid-binding protein